MFGNTCLLSANGYGGKAPATSTRTARTRHRMIRTITTYRIPTTRPEGAAAWPSGRKTPLTISGCSADKASIPPRPPTVISTTSGRTWVIQSIRTSEERGLKDDNVRPQNHTKDSRKLEEFPAV